MKLTLKNVFLSVGIFVFTFALFGLVSTSKAEAQTCTANAPGLWSAATTWNDTDCATYPAGGDTATIPTGITVTIEGAAAAATTLTLSGTAVLTISDTSALSVTGVTTIGAGSTLNTGSGVVTPAGTVELYGNLNIGAGAFDSGAGDTHIYSTGILTFSSAAGAKTFAAVANEGTWTESVPITAITLGNLTNKGTFTTSTGAHTWGTITNAIGGVGGTFNYAVPGGANPLPTLVAAGGVGTFNYTGVAQQPQVIGYFNLGLGGSGLKTIASALTIGGTFIMSGTAQASLTGNSTVAGTFTSNGSAKAIGSWGSGSSLAIHQDNDLFAGTGIITIATGSTGTSITTITTDTPTTTVADTTAPSGTSVSINAGVSTTSSPSSTLTFTAIDATEMMISNDSGFAGASWESYTGSKAWTLTTGDGVKTVYAKFRDAVGNMSTAVIDAITVSGSGTVVVPSNEPVQGCSAGNLFNTSTGAVCVNNAVPQGCSGGNAFNTSTGAICTNNATLQIPGCGNSATGFSTATGVSCAGNHVTTYTTTTYNFGTVTLKNGSKGEAVKELQRFLNAKLNLGLVIDGSLGPKTIAVIKQWQKDNGLVSDGLVGAKTKAMMNQ